MQTSHTAAFSRPTLGFTLEGLSGRDETLFKAIVRLLDHRTLQRWVYQPASPDVRVVAEVVASDSQSGDITAPAPLVLTISTNPGHREHCLGLPLRADELEAELNSLGGERIARFQPATGNRRETHTIAVRLLRWPSAELLGTAERVRLATLMVNRSVTLAWLQQRSGIAPAACAQFFAELHDSGILGAAETPPADPAVRQDRPAAPAATPERTGLLARIRNRLGLLTRPAHS